MPAVKFGVSRCGDEVVWWGWRMEEKDELLEMKKNAGLELAGLA